MKRWSLLVKSPQGDLPPALYSDGEWILGSGSDADLVLPAAKGIAARHAKLWLQSGTLCVEDIGSESGVLVNGSAITGRVEVDYPATIQLGEVTLVVSDAEAPVPAEYSSDSTRRIVHAGIQGDRPAQQPGAQDATGRIYHAASSDVAQEPVATGAPADGDWLSESTIAFAMETDEIQTDGTVTSAVDYALKEEIAKGGMGKIFTAEDAKLERVVALKLSTVKERTEDAQFFTEARVLAQLAHPNIVPIHSIGTDGNGRPFYSMKLVKGRTLQSILKQLTAGDAETARVYSRQRLLTIFRKVCDAVAFAHARGYLHRDLKPENVMVGEFGEVLVMDWGLAKKIWKAGDAAPSRAGASEEPEMLNYVEGTPQYMSPEQAEGVYRDLDERSDIYSLGGILHAILTRRPPVTGASVNEVLHKVRKGETTTMAMPRGSFRVGAPTEMGEAVPEALRAVTLKALSRDKVNRYQSVAALDADIEAYLDGFATSAEEASAFRQFVLFIKRHRAASTLAALLLIGACVFTLRLAASERIANANAVLAEQEAKTAAANAVRAENNAKLAEEQKGRAEANEQKAVAEKETARRAAARAQMALAQSAQQKDNAEDLLEALRAVPEDLRTQEWRYLKRAADSSLLTIRAKADSPWKECVPHPKQPGVLFTLQGDNWVRTLDLTSGAMADVLRLDGSLMSGAFAVSPDAKKIAVVENLQKEPGSQAALCEIAIVTVASGEKKRSPRFPNTGRLRLLFNADGSLLAKVSDIQSSQKKEGAGFAMFDAETGEMLWNRDRFDDGVYDADFKPVYGSLLLATQKNGWLDLDGRTGLERGPAKPLAIAPLIASSQAVFSQRRENIVFMEAGRTKPNFEFRLPKPLENRRNVAFSNNANMLVALAGIADNYAVLQVRDAVYGDLIQSIPVYVDRDEGIYWKMVLHPESGHVAVFRGGTIKVWNLARVDKKTVPNLASNDTSLTGLAFLEPKGDVLQISPVSTGNGSNKGFQFDLFQIQGSALNKLRTLSPENILVEGLPRFASSRDGRISAFILAQAGTYSLQTYRIAQNHELSVSKNPIPAPIGGFVALNPEGNLFWGGNGFYEVPSGKMVQISDRSGFVIPSDRIYAAKTCWLGNEHAVEMTLLKKRDDEGSLSPRCLVLWSVRSAEPVVTMPAVNALSVAANHHGSFVAEGGEDGRVRIRDGKTLKIAQTLRVHDQPVEVVAWHPTLPYLATGSKDLRIKIWNLKTEELVEELGLLERTPSQLQWSQDGRILAVTMYGVRYFLSPKSCQ